MNINESDDFKALEDYHIFYRQWKKVYPKIGVTVFYFWILILAFVGMQLSWNLRPFIASRELPFEIFRERQSNFYIAVVESAADLVNPSEDN